MIAPLAKLIDWSAIQALAMLEPPPHAQGPRLEEGIFEFLRGPGLQFPSKASRRGLSSTPEVGTFRFFHAATV